MHSMPNVDEDISCPTEPVQPTFGPPRATNRKPRLDSVLAEAVETAKHALFDFADDDEVGEYLGATADDERVVTHRFAAQVAGYRGWEFFVTLARAPRSKVVTVCESGMLPGDDALLAPEWVPWRERASEEERVRLDAIAAGEDPVKALEAAGFGPAGTEDDDQHTDDKAQTAPRGSKANAKQARREAKRRRAKQQAARKKRQQSAKRSPQDHDVKK